MQQAGGVREVAGLAHVDLFELLVQVAGRAGRGDRAGEVIVQTFTPQSEAVQFSRRADYAGFAAGEIPKIPLNLPLLKNASIVGVFYGVWSEREAEPAGRNLDQLFAWNAQGRLRPHISATYPLARAADALNDIAARRVMGKAVLQVG